MSSGSVTIGNVLVQAVADGVSVVPPQLLFPGVDAVAWEDHREFLDEDGNIAFPVGAFVVRSADRICLIDAGYGPREVPMMRGGALVASLAAIGIAPGDVTDVLLSHLHNDHFGGVWQHGHATFRNAILRCDVRDWDYFTAGAGRAQHERPLPTAPGIPVEDARWIDLLESVESRIVAWDADGTILPGVDVLRTPGHTPGSTSFVISGGGERLIVVGDVIHCPVQFAHPEWQMVADVDPLLALRARERIEREARASDTRIGGPHFPELRFGRLVHAQARSRWNTMG